MVNVAIHEKYVQTLETFGNLPETIEKAIQCYTVEKITEKITEFQQKVKQYQAKYGMDYPSFEQRIARDEQFVEHIENHINSAWEVDFADWEFCYKGIQDWTRKLNTILLT
jgi:hypothetical protein